MRHHHAVAALWRHAGRLLDRVLLTTWRAAVEFVDDRGHRDAAQIAFFAALSSIPLALLLIGSFGIVFEPTEIRDRILATVLDNIPLAEDGDRPELERTIADSLASAGRLGVLPILLLIVAASGVMSALRHAINQAWDIESRPPLLRRKALDVALVLGAVVILVTITTKMNGRTSPTASSSAAAIDPPVSSSSSNSAARRVAVSESESSGVCFRVGAAAAGRRGQGDRAERRRSCARSDAPKLSGHRLPPRWPPPPSTNAVLSVTIGEVLPARGGPQLLTQAA